MAQYLPKVGKDAGVWVDERMDAFLLCLSFSFSFLVLSPNTRSYRGSYFKSTGGSSKNDAFVSALAVGIQMPIIVERRVLSFCERFNL